MMVAAELGNPSGTGSVYPDVRRVQAPCLSDPRVSISYTIDWYTGRLSRLRAISEAKPQKAGVA